MSVPVDLAELGGVVADAGSGYLLSTSSPSIKVVTIDPVVEPDGRLRVVGPGRGTLANLAANPVVSLVFPPREHHGYTLIVDAEAQAEGDDVLVTPTAAVLHRPASHADAAVAGDGCGHDCAPVATGD